MVRKKKVWHSLSVLFLCPPKLEDWVREDVEGVSWSELVGERKERLISGIKQFIAVDKLENAHSK